MQHFKNLADMHRFNGFAPPENPLQPLVGVFTAPANALCIAIGLLITK
jgi:hypothetical protein